MRLVYVLVGAGLAAGGLAWWLSRDYDPIDELGDLVADLTSTDESRLAQLQPDVSDRVRMLIAQLNSEGIRIKVGQTLRTSAQEKAVIEAGKSAVKTHSWHELGRAVDLYPLDPDSGQPDLDGVHVELFQRMHEVAEGLGFRSIAFNSDGSKHLIQGKNGPIWDGGHIEWREPYGSIAEAVAAEGAAYGIA
jgi:hypothetical protein